MIRKVSRSEIDIMHISQMVERKKAILVNLQLMVSKKENNKQKVGIENVEADPELIKRYAMEGMIQIGNRMYPKQIHLTNYFRGENAWYLNGKASLFRHLPHTETEKAAYYEKHKMEAELFCKKVLTAGSAQKSAAEKIYGEEICRELLSHHYGMPSAWQEFTSNFDEALFYACCVYEDQHWRPLNKREIETDHKYGLIYSALTDYKGFYERQRDERNAGLMIPIGEVPFMRCHPQYSYAMKMNPEDDLREDERFDCMVFEHTEAICQAVFRRMSNGELIFRKNVRNFEKIQDMHINS